MSPDTTRQGQGITMEARMTDLLKDGIEFASLVSPLIFGVLMAIKMAYKVAQSL